MKKYIKIIAVLLIFSVFLVFSGCQDEGTTEVIYPIKSARYYTNTHEHGVIAVKTDVIEYIEVVYTTEDGTTEKYDLRLDYVDIGTENIVIIRNKGKISETREIILTEDYYNKICGIQYVKNEES